jgi:hypothetical protein
MKPKDFLRARRFMKPKTGVRARNKVLVESSVNAHVEFQEWIDSADVEIYDTGEDWASLRMFKD